MKKLLVTLLAAIMALTLCFSMGACGKAASGSGDTQAAGGATEAAPVEGADADYAKIREKGKLVVGITDFEPMDYKDESGKWIGFDADLANMFAESLGVTAEFVEIEWDYKIMTLDSKAIDCVWNGMTLTDEVKTAMETSNA